MDDLADMRLIVPLCPDCGSECLYLRRQTYPGELVPVTCQNIACNWAGTAPQQLQIPPIAIRRQREM